MPQTEALVQGTYLEDQVTWPKPWAPPEAKGHYGTRFKGRIV
jgi:hypothetical protein